MAQTALGGNPVNTIGELPSVGSATPSFSVTKADLSDITPADLAGQRVVINIFPSLDTATCATSVRKFNELASGLDNTTVLCVSADLPFAQARFCGAEGLSNVDDGVDLPQRLRHRLRREDDRWQDGRTDGPLGRRAR